jgi:hypothetical protein
MRALPWGTFRIICTYPPGSEAPNISLLSTQERMLPRGAARRGSPKPGCCGAHASALAWQPRPPLD